MDCIKEEYNYRNTLIEMSDTLLTYKNIIYQKISTITFQAGEVSNKDRQQLSPSLFIGSSLLEMSNLKRKRILDLPTLRYLCAILCLSSSTYLPQLCRRTFLCLCLDDVLPFIAYL